MKLDDDIDFLNNYIIEFYIVNCLYNIFHEKGLLFFPLHKSNETSTHDPSCQCARYLLEAGCNVKVLEGGLGGGEMKDVVLHRESLVVVVLGEAMSQR